MRAIGALLLVLALAGFGSCQRRSEAPIADASPECYRAAVPSIDPPDTGVRWQVDPEDPAAFDVLAETVIPALIQRALAGERSRQACAGFINDLKKRGVIRAKE